MVGGDQAELVPGSNDHFQRWVVVFVLGAAFLLSVRLLRLVDLHAVNLLYFDQFSLYDAFTGDTNAWELFRWQHGPHRQGVAFFLTSAIANLSAWNTRVEAFAVGIVTCVAALLALGLRRRISGPFRSADVAIPLLLLTPAQYGVFLHTPNTSHAAGPLLLLMLYGLAWTLADRRWRYGSIVALDFLMVHTGFALFVGAITPALLAIACLHELRAGGRSAVLLPLASVALSLAWVALFFVGYTERGGIDLIEFPSPRWLLYPQYAALMFANVLGVKGVGPLPTLIGGAAALAAVGVALRQLFVLMRAGENGAPGPRPFVILSLTVFTLLYSAATAVGRIHLGLPGAQSTRYVPLVVPAFLGLYFALLGIRNEKLRRGLVVASAAVMVAATFPMRAQEARFLQRLSQGKRIWVETYLETRDMEAAERAARLKIYFRRTPGDRIPEKLEYMRQHHLNFFAEDRRRDLGR
jgi:hypothetical protein